MVKHEKDCPGGCLGTAEDYLGDPCAWRPVEPVEHTEGIKKWDDATAAWVDAVPNDDCWTVGRDVHLSDGTTVTDGDPSIHWGESWNDIELEKEGYVH